MNETTKLIIAGSILGASMIVPLLALIIDLVPIVIGLGTGATMIR